MKKLLALAQAVVMALGMVACGDKNQPEKPDEKTDTPPVEESTAKIQLTENNGILEAVDVTTSPLEGCGVHVQVNKAEGTVTFIKTDDAGQDTTEYYKFTPAKNEVEQFYFVAMMGTGFYYYFDTTAGEMVRMEDMDHNDSTQSAKDNGRFDKAAEGLKADVTALQTYFETNYGMSIADAASGK